MNTETATQIEIKPTPEALAPLVTQQQLAAATALVRYANYYTPYGFKPEIEDVQRCERLVERPASEVFRLSKPDFVARVEAVREQFRTARDTVRMMEQMGAHPTIDWQDAVRIALEELV